MLRTKKNSEIERGKVGENDIKKLSFLDCINEIEGEQRPWNELSEAFHKAYNQFMINRFVSSKEHYVRPIEIISRLGVSDELHYSYLITFINKQKHYFNYKAYKTSKDEDKLAIYALRKQYEISPREAMTYYEALTDEQHPNGLAELDRIKNKWTEHYKLFSSDK